MGQLRPGCTRRNINGLKWEKIREQKKNASFSFIQIQDGIIYLYNN